MKERLGELRPQRFPSGNGREVTGNHRATMLPGAGHLLHDQCCLGTGGGDFEKIRPKN